MIQITASRATQFLALCYTVFAEKLQNPTKKADDEATLEISKLAKDVLPTWGRTIPALRQILIDVLKGHNKEEAFQKLGLILKQIVPQGKGDSQVPIQELELLHAIGAYFRTGNENMAKKLVKFASLSKSPYVVQRLAPKVGDQQSTKQKLTKFIKQHVGRTDTAMTPEEALKVKEINPEAYKEYLALRRDFNQSWKDALANFVRKSGKHVVPFKDASNFLRMNGIDHMMPTGFTGSIDDMGRFYTKQGKLVEGVPAATLFPSIHMNPNYGKANGGDWVFMAVRTDGSPGPYFYTSEFKKAQSHSKFAKVGELGKKIDGMRKKWLSKVKAFSVEDPQAVAATVLEILYEFAARIGSNGNSAGGTATYGVATLLAKHATIMPDGSIVLRYKGKDGVPTTHKITKATAEGKLLIRNLNELLADKGPKDRIFTVTKGHRQVPITPPQVNQMFKACGAPADVTVHKIRTVTGTKIFKGLMDEVLGEGKRRPKDEKQAMVLFKKLAEAVGKKLNHMRTTTDGGSKVTGATALAAYVDPLAQLEFWYTLGFRVPKSLEKFDQALSGEHSH